MTTSPDTVLRLVRGLPLPASGSPHAIGIDDWAFRKGRPYGTLLVDLERRRPLDLLPDRSGATVAAWLRCQPQIAVISRDRSTEYFKPNSLWKTRGSLDHLNAMAEDCEGGR